MIYLLHLLPNCLYSLFNAFHNIFSIVFWHINIHGFTSKIIMTDLCMGVGYADDYK